MAAPPKNHRLEFGGVFIEQKVIDTSQIFAALHLNHVFFTQIVKCQLNPLPNTMFRLILCAEKAIVSCGVSVYNKKQIMHGIREGFMYQNIIFDFGGVVVDYNPRNFLMDRFMNKHAEEIVYDLTFGSQEWQDLDRGTITRAVANRTMMENAAHVNREFEVRTVIEEWSSMLRTKKTTVKIMRALKKSGYRLYYLTNIPVDIMDEMRQRDWFSLFDGGIASCDVHLCKPEPEIYTTLMQECNLAYDESIFVDDNKINAQAAYNLGITGILYKNPKSFLRALGACGIQLK